MSCVRNQDHMDVNFQSTVEEKLSRSLPISRAMNWMSEIVTLVGTWRERARSRRALQRLNNHLLNDIGLSKSDVSIETAKAFWER